ncbi:unnamed protein product, partial [Staurois parvus]
DRAIVIQSVRALKREKWPGQEGVKLPGIQMVKIIPGDPAKKVFVQALSIWGNDCVPH